MSTPISGVDALVMISDTLNVVEHSLLELSPTSTLEYSLVVMRLSSWCVLDPLRGRSFNRADVSVLLFERSLEFYFSCLLGLETMVSSVTLLSKHLDQQHPILQDFRQR